MNQMMGDLTTQHEFYTSIVKNIEFVPTLALALALAHTSLRVPNSYLKKLKMNLKNRAS